MKNRRQIRANQRTGRMNRAKKMQGDGEDAAIYDGSGYP